MLLWRETFTILNTEGHSPPRWWRARPQRVAGELEGIEAGRFVAGNGILPQGDRGGPCKKVGKTRSGRQGWTARRSPKAGRDMQSGPSRVGPIGLTDEAIRARIQLFPAKPNLDPARRCAEMRSAYNVRSCDGSVQVSRLDESAPSDFIIVCQTETPIFWHSNSTKVPRSVCRAPVEIAATWILSGAPGWRLL